MHGALAPLPHTSSWRSDQLGTECLQGVVLFVKHRGKFTFTFMSDDSNLDYLCSGDTVQYVQLKSTLTVAVLSTGHKQSFRSEQRTGSVGGPPTNWRQRNTVKGQA
jgi:hypothetical protein